MTEHEGKIPKEVLLSMPVEELEISEWRMSKLKEVGIETIGQLLEQSKEDLLNIRNYGRTGVAETQAALEEIGLYLKGEDPNESER